MKNLPFSKVSGFRPAVFGLAALGLQACAPAGPVNDPIPGAYIPTDPRNAERYGTATGIVGGYVIGSVIDEAIGDNSGYGGVLGGVYGGLAGGAVARDVAQERAKARGGGCQQVRIEGQGRRPRVKTVCPNAQGQLVLQQ